jgi:phosphoribosylanthranilate isomerase
MTSAEDVALAVAAGADAVGFIVAPSERQISVEQIAKLAPSIPPLVSAIAVLGEDTSPAPELRDLGFILQFSGPTPPEECERLSAGRPYIKAFYVDAAGTIDGGSLELRPAGYVHALWMFDAASPTRLGGSGIVFRWEVVGEFARERKLVIAGGLNAENVGALISTVHPYAVDVRTGIERNGKKDAERMVAFVAAVRSADG